MGSISVCSPKKWFKKVECIVTSSIAINILKENEIIEIKENVIFKMSILVFIMLTFIFKNLKTLYILIIVCI